ncbi:hypothetical protein SERLA73DRAFT_159481 [Serpula lacrymans var. lacrymans S7.3]|uniref:Uncharacterized protein n=2 Tax=Serpula lacrymans var. lacrymans TaxID=341189 RepID=F8PSW6_SERL3|nr:uncharacterized protein SERLADRAFT_414443 [Serpula lacrymans var. lacrymans S7.9]EGO00824.1 hypothetical protein SERLA73DRAFT_159481 [Serpula lacrymans var. lacrymans S7.3]EGO26381.1 hypothetical protein SERLADRAFT_414443 [Serpula lacrymans var. lacrymans S7.9]
MNDVKQGSAVFYYWEGAVVKKKTEGRTTPGQQRAGIISVILPGHDNLGEPVEIKFISLIMGAAKSMGHTEADAPDSRTQVRNYHRKIGRETGMRYGDECACTTMCFTKLANEG